MSLARRPADVVLPPAAWWIGRRPARVRTLLGSCVALTCWHARSGIGAMCHCLLPRAEVPDSGDPRYVDGALRLMSRALQARGIDITECEWKVFGGARMFDLAATGLPDVGERNIEAARALLAATGCEPRAQDVGGLGHREIVFDLRTGSVWSRHAPPLRRLPKGAR